MTIISIIDLRGLHGVARDQGSRPTCLAFALSDLNGHRHEQPGQLSAEYLYREAASLMQGWKPGDGLQVDAALHAVSSPGQALEVAVPYAPVEPALPLISNPPCAPLFTGKYALQVPVMRAIEDALANDQSIGLVTRLTVEFFSASTIAAQIPYSPHAIFGLSHAIVVVGIGHDATTLERHVLIRNSWGTSWGHGGHAWLPESYIDNHTLCAFGG